MAQRVYTIKKHETRMKRFITKKKIVAAIILIIIGWFGYRALFGSSAPAYQLATAARGTMTQVVSVTGNTAPVHSVDLAFESGGTIASVNADVGAHVNAGEAIVQLDTSDL